MVIQTLIIKKFVPGKKVNSIIN